MPHMVLDRTAARRNDQDIEKYVDQLEWSKVDTCTLLAIVHERPTTFEAENYSVFHATESVRTLNSFLSRFMNHDAQRKLAVL